MRRRRIAKEIIQMAKVDQKIRKSYLKNPSLFKELERVDNLSLKKMKEIVKKFGWPTVSLVGKKASRLAWLLIQHADKDVDFQKHCLELMKKEVQSGEITKSDIAFLTDRILVNRNSPQIYGTQFYRDKAGKLVPKPIRDIGNIDRMRKEMNLQPFSVYLKRIKKN